MKDIYQVDKYTYFNDLQFGDFVYITKRLKDKGIIKVDKPYSELADALREILEDYIEYEELEEN